MKCVPTIMILFFKLIVVSAVAQTERVKAVYLNSRDYDNNVALFDNKCKAGMPKIKLNDFFARSYITIKLNGGKAKIKKRELFGYINCKNMVFSFKGKKELLLLNEGDSILVYKHIITKSSVGRTNATNYYFSQGLHSVPELLTIGNIKNRFRENTSFCNSIDTNFKYNTDLAEFADYKRKFRINILLNQTVD